MSEEVKGDKGSVSRELDENFIHTKYGYCYYEIGQDSRPIIFNLYVHPEYRRQGHAEKLLRDVIGEIRASGYEGEIDIEAQPREQSIDRDALVNFYKKLGLNVLNESNTQVDDLMGLVKKAEAERDSLCTALGCYEDETERALKLIAENNKTLQIYEKALYDIRRIGNDEQKDTFSAHDSMFVMANNAIVEVEKLREKELNG